MKAVVLGSGGWGTAIAMLLCGNGHEVTLWSHNSEKAENLSLTRENPLLRNVHIPEEITVTSDMNCLRNADVVVFASPSFALREIAKKAAAYLSSKAVLVSATKGIERGTHLRMSQIIEQETEGKYPVAVLSGPSHAEEVARDIPTGCVIAAKEEALAKQLQAAFTGKNFRTYTHDDMVGVELGGALKNVAALCCGISDGIGMGDNTKALLITRAVAEMSRLAVKLGGRNETLAGLAGLGDLIVTCTSTHSRNYRAGFAIGQGKAPQAVVEEMGAVVEGYYAACSAHELCIQTGAEMPICEAVYEVLYCGTDVTEGLRKLMNREMKAECGSVWG